MSHTTIEGPFLFVQEELSSTTYEWLCKLDCPVDVRLEKRNCTLKKFRAPTCTQTTYFMYGWKYHFLRFINHINKRLAWEIGMLLPHDDFVIMFV